MNIFILDKDPRLAAQYHNDKHCIKMILESVQMLCNAITIFGTPNSLTYKLTHLKHPCSLWVCESLENWLWLYRLTKFLNIEYKYRYNKTEDHKSFLVLQSQKCLILKSKIPNIKMTPFKMAMPIDYQNKNVVDSYRTYYRKDKLTWGNNKPSTWTKRGKPYWL